ncbi:hypothetical protein ACFYTS_00965 [Nocardia sp. NPDC004151]|uniref:hypothetical protein n=1 Tax=Nocardia sp. NPDC004151 TaxID=3364304 RepID=UPI0036889B5F
MYVEIVIITIYWVAVFVSSQGTKTVAGLSSMGLIVGTLIPGALLVVLGFVPPSQYGSGNALSYVVLIGGGMGVVGLLIPYLFLRFRKPGWKTEVPQEALA